MEGKNKRCVSLYTTEKKQGGNEGAKKGREKK